MHIPQKANDPGFKPQHQQKIIQQDGIDNPIPRYYKDFMPPTNMIIEGCIRFQIEAGGGINVPQKEYKIEKQNNTKNDQVLHQEEKEKNI